MTKRAYPKPPPATGAEAILRDYALTFEDVVEEFPWGHRAMKVRGKIFVIFGGDADAVRIATKLPKTGKTALERPNCEPTPYGMGKHGWVTSIWSPFQEPDVVALMDWIAESYEAIATPTRGQSSRGQSTRGKSTARKTSKTATSKRATKVSKPVNSRKPAATRTATKKAATANRAATKSPAKQGSSKSRQPSRNTRSTKTRR